MNASVFLRPALVLLLLLTLAAGASADTIVLKNGDRVSGKVVQSNREELVVQAEFMGEVTIQWAAVQEISSDAELYVQASDGQVLAGPVQTSGDQFRVQTASAGTVTVPISMVDAIRSPDSQAAYEAEIERLRNPGLLDFWSGFFDAGYSVASGNASSSTVATSSRIHRTTQRDKISVYYTQLFSRNRPPEGETQTTANAIRGGTRYDIDISDRLFTFAFVDLEFDEFQDLDLRNVLGGGLGYHIIKSENLTFDFFSGGSFNQEFFNTGLTRRSGELVLGEESDWTISENTNWTQRLAVYPNLTNGGEYRMQFDTSLATKLNDWLAWHITFSDRFLSNPLPGRKKNDTLMSTGLRVSFGKQ